MDMGRNSLIFQPTIKIDKETFIDLYLFFIAVRILYLVCTVLMDKQIHLTFNT